MLPSIQSISFNKGSDNGQILTLSGKGFSNTLNKIQVTAGNLPCSVVNSNIEKITCQVQAGATTNNPT